MTNNHYTITVKLANKPDSPGTKLTKLAIETPAGDLGWIEPFIQDEMALQEGPASYVAKRGTSIVKRGEIDLGERLPVDQHKPGCMCLACFERELATHPADCGCMSCKDIRRAEQRKIAKAIKPRPKVGWMDEEDMNRDSGDGLDGIEFRIVEEGIATAYCDGEAVANVTFVGRAATGRFHIDMTDGSYMEAYCETIRSVRSHIRWHVQQPPEEHDPEAAYCVCPDCLAARVAENKQASPLPLRTDPRTLPKGRLAPFASY